MQTYTDETKAQVILAWKAGEATKALSRQFGVPETTLRGWFKGLTRAPVAPKKENRSIDDLAYELVSETFRSLIAVAKQAQDPEWLKAQPAEGLHLFFGVGADKVIRLYEAINPDRLRQLESGRD